MQIYTSSAAVVDADTAPLPPNTSTTSAAAPMFTDHAVSPLTDKLYFPTKVTVNDTTPLSVSNTLVDSPPAPESDTGRDSNEMSVQSAPLSAQERSTRELLSSENKVLVESKPADELQPEANAESNKAADVTSNQASFNSEMASAPLPSGAQLFFFAF